MIRIESGSSLATGDGSAPGACFHSRRGFMAGVAATTFAAASPALAQDLKSPSPRRIDVHHHCYPAKWFAAKRSAILGSSDNPSSIMTEWTPARAIEQMDRHGIATAMASVGNPGIWFGDVAEARELQCSCNEYMADMARDFPGRFGVFAALALPDVEGCLREIEYAFDTLKVDGVHLLTSYGDKWPGDPAFDPVMAELNRRKAAVFIHPTAPDCCGSLKTGAPQSILELPFDEARAIGSLVFNGVVSKYRDIRFIFTHAGGPMPVLSARMEQLMRNPKVAERVPEGIGAALKTLYFDVANSTINPSAMAAIMALAPASNLMFGSDFPYVAIDKTIGGLDGMKLTADMRAAINRDNAAKLFPRFA
jgi:predicted TIM-barrel fold metal-dependent hydrolase